MEERRLFLTHGVTNGVTNYNGTNISVIIRLGFDFVAIELLGSASLGFLETHIVFH